MTVGIGVDGVVGVVGGGVVAGEVVGGSGHPLEGRGGTLGGVEVTNTFKNGCSRHS